MKKNNKTERINILVTPEEKELMQKYCIENDTSISQLIRWAVRDYIQDSSSDRNN